MFVGDSGNARIQVFGDDGVFRRQFPGLHPDELHIAVAQNGDLVVADTDAPLCRALSGDGGWS